MPKAHLITLGCPKNTVDSERMHRKLEAGGYEVIDDAESADVIVVNTCGFIEPAKEESIATILEAADHRTGGACRGLIVTGCLAQRYESELLEELSEVDLVVGLAGEREIVTHCDRLLDRSPVSGATGAAGGGSQPGDRHLLTPAHWAYLRISDGCDRTCSFCAIPGIRGQSRSQPIERLVAETEQLAASGTREIVLISQDTMRYGADLYGRPRLTDLMGELLGVREVAWFRLMYTYPSGWREDLVDLLANEPRLCGYVDMPIQHASDPVLKRMNRGTTQDGTRRLVERLRSRVPELAIRSSVIVGFPGETDADFREMLAFVEEMQFSRLVGFLYSHEEGTAAGELEDDVPDGVKRERLNELMEVQRRIASDFHASCIGHRYTVLVDRAHEGAEFDFVGRTRMDAPEVDGEVFISGAARVGAFSDVTVTDAVDYDLIGTAGADVLVGIAPADEIGEAT